MENITIIIPVVRPKKSRNCIRAIRSDGFKGQILTMKDKEKAGCPEMVRRLTEKARGQIIVFLGDDTLPRKGWLQAGLDKMASLPDGWGVVGLKTEPDNENAHWMADMRMLDLLPDREFFNTEYKHAYCDDELAEIASENGRWAVTDDVVIDHDHPINGGESDQFYLRAYSQSFKKTDKRTYIRRKRERLGGLAIGFPLVDPTVPVQFFTSFACMEKPSQYTLLVPKFPHGPWTGSIADARNSLIEQAQQNGCKYLLMMDTDQIYPSDTLVKLLSHKKDICGVRVHRRYPPFDPVFYRGTLGKYMSVSDEEMYSGDLIEVDATGTGCLLLDMAMFDRLYFPWFSFSKVDGKPVGEDIYFCSKAREAGKQIYIDTSIEVGHLTTMEVGKTMHKLCKKLMEA